MKKILLFILILLCILTVSSCSKKEKIVTTATTTAKINDELKSGQELIDITIEYNGKKVKDKVTSIKAGNVIFMPYKEMLSAVGIQENCMKFTEKTKSLQILKPYPNMFMFFAAGSDMILVRESPASGNGAPIFYNNTLYIPAKFTVSSLGYKVDLNNNVLSVSDLT